MVLSITPKTMVPLGAAAAVLIALVSFASYWHGIDERTRASQKTDEQHAAAIAALDTTVADGLAGVRTEMRSAVDGVRAEMVAGLSKVPTRDELSLMLSEASSRALVEHLRETGALRGDLMREIGDIKSRLKSLEDNGHRTSQ